MVVHEDAPTDKRRGKENVMGDDDDDGDNNGNNQNVADWSSLELLIGVRVRVNFFREEKKSVVDLFVLSLI